ncbi:hypothetical protein AB6A40_011556 [Gnathostoma spinigerum]|uniref:Uncharacterized protein n=1 Tax=Gnathostoma spinigerum TaxID=75299 RepID=A0ABD6F4I4_9BILA
MSIFHAQIVEMRVDVNHKFPSYRNQRYQDMWHNVNGICEGGSVTLSAHSVMSGSQLFDSVKVSKVVQRYT